ncbi:Fe-S cluster assembly protein SufD [Microcoleus sp. FACHB-831]|uniref:Fe-S cluster assembly protein SufD n=1 Tax=Microcoleus sp. FACHB-831 TaxID=2692827 RepID=UPI001686EAF6|nr:Fe-S cluster assembly protein SufD [Microcoleus sp. FACHB-831]MBD1920386.1 Fe-S cluster assembly protein SufD [Microcoleus sp. FACHB-831]
MSQVRSIPSPEEIGLKPAASNRDAKLTELLTQSQSVPLQIIEPEILSWLKELRDRASAWIPNFKFPTTRDEEWRFTDISPLLQLSFQAAKPVDLPASAIEGLALAEAANSRLVFVNGVYAPALSSVANLPDGIFVGNLAQLPIVYRTRIGNYLAQQEGADDVFTALNTAGLTDAAIVWVSKNVVVETPIHLLFLSTFSDAPSVSQQRCLVVAETNSQVTLIEDYLPVGDWCADKTHPYLINSVTEVWAEENAQIHHNRVQRDSGAAFHIGKTAIAQSRHSRYTCTSVSLGGKISRHNLEVSQLGEQTETTLNGLTMIAGEQVGDLHSAIALTYPHSITRQVQKNIVSDRAHAVFNGRVFVAKAAQLTDAGQLNRTLLLSPKARVDTKPQLEIIADNVKCSHGATVSQLDDEEVFYLQSRGLDKASAHNLLIDAFAIEIINQIPVESLQKSLSRCVACRTIE